MIIWLRWMLLVVAIAAMGFVRTNAYGQVALAGVAFGCIGAILGTFCRDTVFYAILLGLVGTMIGTFLLWLALAPGPGFD